MSNYKHIDFDAFLGYVDKAAWEMLLRNRGGCSCHLSPPCGACLNEVTEEELNEVGYTYEEPK